MPKQVYSPLDRIEDHSSSSRYQDLPSGQGPNGGMPMASGAASLRSAVSKKSRRARRVDNDELSVPLHLAAGAEGGAGSGFGEDQQFEDLDLEAPASAVPLDDDPFYVFREDLTRKLFLVDEALKRYLNVIHDTDTAVNTHAVKDAKKQMKRALKNADGTLSDLQTTVTLVESRRAQFSHIDDAELYDRRTFVQTSRERLERARGEMASDSVRFKTGADGRAKAERRAGGGGGRGGAQRSREEEEAAEFVGDARTQAQTMLSQQDEALEGLDEAVTRVGIMAEDIHEELGQQNKMLADFDDDLADAEEKLGLVMGKLGKLLKTKNRCQLGTILVLCLIVLILLFLVIYT